MSTHWLPSSLMSLSDSVVELCCLTHTVGHWWCQCTDTVRVWWAGSFWVQHCVSDAGEWAVDFNADASFVRSDIQRAPLGCRSHRILFDLVRHCLLCLHCNHSPVIQHGLHFWCPGMGGWFQWWHYLYQEWYPGWLHWGADHRILSSLVRCPLCQHCNHCAVIQDHCSSPWADLPFCLISMSVSAFSTCSHKFCMDGSPCVCSISVYWHLLGISHIDFWLGSFMSWLSGFPSCCTTSSAHFRLYFCRHLVPVAGYVRSFVGVQLCGGSRARHSWAHGLVTSGHCGLRPGEPRDSRRLSLTTEEARRAITSAAEVTTVEC